MLPLLVFTMLAAEPERDLTVELRPLLSIAYVNDEVRDETGRWTYFAHPELTAPSPGLNCSGFVVTATRHLLGRAPTLTEVTRDRLGDSGDDAPFGKDWDFGFDLVMNLSEGLPRVALVPASDEALDGRDGIDGKSERGFAFDDVAAWKRVLPRVQLGRVYLASLSRHFGKGLQHHHVAMLLRDSAGKVWFYQTLPKGRSHRVEVTSPAGFATLQKMFGRGISLLLVEVQRPPVEAR